MRATGGERNGERGGERDGERGGERGGESGRERGHQSSSSPRSRSGSASLPPQIAYQMEFGRYHRHVAPKAHTLLTDYRCFTLPNTVHSTFSGHSANVKCVEFVGAQGVFLASGGSDNTVRIWRTDESARHHIVTSKNYCMYACTRP